MAVVRTHHYTVDPADTPPRGIFDVIWKALFGA